MKIQLSPVLVLLLLVLSLPCGAEEKSPEVLVREFIECLEAGLERANKDYEAAAGDEIKQRASMTDRNAYNQVLQNVRSLPLLLGSGNVEDAQRYLLRVQVPASSECGSYLTKINDAITLQISADEVAFTGDIEAFKAEAGVALLEAKAVSELDDLFIKLEALRQRSAKLGRNSNHSSDLSNLNRIFSSWQEYLAYAKAGDLRKALSAINNITSAVTNTPVIPRSELVKRKLELEGLSAQESNSPRESEPPNTVAAVLSTADSIEKVPQIRKQLEELAGFSKTRNDANNALRVLEKLETALQLIEQGSPLLSFAYLNELNPQYNNLQWIAGLKDEAGAKALFHSIPEKYRPEKLEGVITSVALPAAEKMTASGDWLELWEMLKVITQLYNRKAESFIPSINNDIKAIERFLTALSLQESGQLAKALDAYNRVLEYTGVYGPYRVAERNIRFLRTQQAEELAADQEKESKVPVKQAYVDPQFSGHPAFRHDMRSPDFSRMVEDLAEKAAEEKIKTYLAAEKAKAAKAETTAPEK